MQAVVLYLVIGFWFSLGMVIDDEIFPPLDKFMVGLLIMICWPFVLAQEIKP